MNFTGQTWWIIGASEGLGLGIAQRMSAAGATVVLSARNAARLNQIAADMPAARALPMDVSDSDAVAGALRDLGDIDGVMYCAGAYAPMTAQNWDSSKAVQVAEVNFIGALRVLGGVIPEMVRRNAGRVVLIGSLSGFRGLPGAIGYGASKAGLMHLAENMAVDLAGTGVQVQLVNPGFIKTRLTAQNDFNMPMIMDVNTAAGHVIDAIRSGRFQTNFPRRFSWLFRALQFVPMGIHRRIFARRG